MHLQIVLKYVFGQRCHVDTCPRRRPLLARNRRAEDQPKYPLLDVVRHRKCAPIATNNHNRAIITARTASRPHHGRKAAPRVDCGGGAAILWRRSAVQFGDGTYAGYQHIVSWQLLVQPHELASYRLLCLHVQTGRKVPRALQLRDTPQEQAAGRQADWRWVSIRGRRPVCRAQGTDRTPSRASERETAAFLKAASVGDACFRPLRPRLKNAVAMPRLFNFDQLFSFGVAHSIPHSVTQRGRFKNTLTSGR